MSRRFDNFQKVVKSNRNLIEGTDENKKMRKIISLALIISLLTGCGLVIRKLDSSGWDEHRQAYEKSQTLPPLEIPPELATAKPS